MTESTLTIIIGPTAIGKTAYAIEKALKENALIVSADSMQIYRGMDIGTGKPTAEQKAQVKHYLMDVINPDDEFSVSKFVEYCQYDMNKIREKGKNILIVGGTGLYLNALINGFSFPMTSKNEKFRKNIEIEIKARGLGYFHDRLKEKDPASAAKIHTNDEKRIIRALEILNETGKPKSELAQKGESILPKGYQIIGLNLDREKLYENINSRVDKMFHEGLVNEVTGLIQKYPQTLPAFQGIGYKEVIEHLNGKLKLDECVELVKKKTRNFAKRQMTWFRKFPNVQWIEGTDFPKWRSRGFWDDPV